MSVTGIKRPRSTNFTASETECLVEEVIKRASVIENKRTDAVTWKQKEEAWENLTLTFNARTSGNRTEKMLKVKYDGIKRAIKQKHNKAKYNQFKTGGGAADIMVYTPFEEKLIRIISLSVEGLLTQNDSDEVGNKRPNENSEIEITETEQHALLNDQDELLMNDQVECEITENIDPPKNIKVANWEVWNPSKLKSRRHKLLKKSIEKHDVGESYMSIANSRSDLIDIQKNIAEQELAKISLQMEFLRKDDARKEEQHQLRVKFATIEHNAKIELINLKKEEIMK